ncbi:transcriptional regulator, MarR family [Candidatus Koribacter versatilis Ellin345]|uniref:Transcriptional regulator, MarR family n=1 Tax=Koribacter versatilis (strain Ellin345) TaxID=204669 RepID=Q1IME5_KORVE|nr:MarR family transcriptional regulator [Candidatus Koribacter versatilis]ABF41955.1 transcriptional regulator, MarR family [Candidatus Koribacter versatilis Ellin345]
MVGNIQAEIKQNKPLTPEQEVLLTIQRTADAFERRVAELFKPYGLSGTQYNVLRILRGAGKDGLPCGAIAERMVTRDPDITRLLDRLDKMGYIGRERGQKDRRVVYTTITEAGLKLLKQLDKPVQDLGFALVENLNKSQMQELVELLDLARSSAG